MVSFTHSTSGSNPDGTIYAVAVLAFKAVYTLEVTRRENDKRIHALYAEYVVQPPSAVRRLISLMAG